MSKNFIGRTQELQQLQTLLKKNSASIVVIKGRRRIGKSRLIQEFAKPFRSYFFSGVPPLEKTTLQDELKEFGWQLGKALEAPPFQEDNWNSLFLRLAHHTRRGRVVVVLDEISWMGSCDPHFLGKLKNAWDLEFKKNPQFILILCGSVSTWIDKNILNSTGFVGRISLEMNVEELSLSECHQFWGKYQHHIAAYEKFKLLSVTGGVPKYLEEILPSEPAEENIKRMCFDKSGFLFHEFDKIFTDIFYKRSDIYKNIISCLGSGSCEYDEIYKKLHVEKSGTISSYLEDLVKSSFVRRDFIWDFKQGSPSKLSRYRVSDNYLRFYLNYIEPNKAKIEKGLFQKKSLMLLPGMEGMFGLQFENLVLNNRRKLLEILNIDTNDVVNDNPFFQHKTTRQEGCQIDYLIQTGFGSFYVCEIKFSKYPISKSILTEMETKMKKLKTPRHTSRRPVLIHVNGVEDAVLESGYFYRIIDFASLL
ncbi:MAG: ATP-binding protein [Bdellovibrionota bacterium]